jgi:large subunit ribosomal protein L4
MTDIRVFSVEGKEGKAKPIPKEWSDRAVSYSLIHQVAVGQEHNSRIYRAHTKDRGDRRGGGKKPWRQKGTGRARHGSSRSPIWRGGGITFGPRSERVYGKKVPVAMQRAALRDVLVGKANDGELTLVEAFPKIGGKTKELLSFLVTMKEHHTHSVLLLVSEVRIPIRRAASNIPHVVVGNPENVSVLDLLSTKVVIADEQGLEALISRTTRNEKVASTKKEK